MAGKQPGDRPYVRRELWRQMIVMKVQFCESSKKLLGFFVICLGCFFLGSISSEVIDGFVFSNADGNSGYEISARSQVCTLEFSQTTGLAVPHVLGMVSKPDVALAVVKPVTIDMINEFSFLGVKYEPVHEYSWMTSGGSIPITRSSFYRSPSHGLDEMKIGIIDLGYLSKREKYLCHEANIARCGDLSRRRIVQLER